MTDAPPKSEPTYQPPRKWKQSEALRAIEILKEDDHNKWDRYVFEELNGAQISDEIGTWMMEKISRSLDLDVREVVGLFLKIRQNMNPKWIEYSGDDK